MLTPFSHIATALIFLAAGQLPFGSVSSGWISKPPTHRCSAESHDHWADPPAAATRKAAAGRSASQSIRILSFGP